MVLRRSENKRVRRVRAASRFSAMQCCCPSIGPAAFGTWSPVQSPPRREPFSRPPPPSSSIPLHSEKVKSALLLLRFRFAIISDVGLNVTSSKNRCPKVKSRSKKIFNSRRMRRCTQSTWRINITKSKHG